MRRREFISILGTVMVALPLTVRAQQRGTLLAILSPRRHADAWKLIHEPFKQALARLGWEPARNLDIVERFADGDDSRLPALAAELVSLKPRVLFTWTSEAATAAAEATRTIPIVVGPTHAVTLTALAGGSIARPTTNVTGFVVTAPEVDDKCITLLMEAAPSATRIGVLANPDNSSHQSYPAAFKDARSVAGKTLIRIDSRGRADIDAALAKAGAERIDALFVAADARIAGDPGVRRRVLAFAAGASVPVASTHQD
jgi:putative ABC transport system substrate-binding protein